MAKVKCRPEGVSKTGRKTEKVKSYRRSKPKRIRSKKCG